MRAISDSLPNLERRLENRMDRLERAIGYQNDRFVRCFSPSHKFLRVFFYFVKMVNGESLMDLSDAPGPETFATRAADKAWPEPGVLENFYIINSGQRRRPTSNRVPFSDPEDLEKISTIRSN